MLFTPAVLAVLVEDRQIRVASELAFARRAGVRRAVAGVVLQLGASITHLGDVLDEEPAAPAHLTRLRAR